ncbi:efflux RND transporter permease subunit [Cupriavidus basilensis]
MTRFNNFPAVKITANAAPGYSSGQVLSTLQEVADEVMPNDYGVGWSGEAYEALKASSSSALVFVFGLVMVFLILAAQYEEVELAGGRADGGAVRAFRRVACHPAAWPRERRLLPDRPDDAGRAGGQERDPDLRVCRAEPGAGESVYDAAVTAATERLRPIVMTSLAFILGCVPLAIALGASANSRHSIGTGVIGGMLGATVIAVFFIPMFFYVLETMSEKKAGARRLPVRKAARLARPAPGSIGAGAGGPTATPSARREDEVTCALRLFR